jgi:hypothetical protein
MGVRPYEKGWEKLKGDRMRVNYWGGMGVDMD